MDETEDDDRTESIDDDREYHVAPSEDEVPFHIPRD
jgi:hypothetical protein